MNRSKIAILVIAAAVGVVAVVVVMLRVGHWRPGSITIQGAVIRSDEDIRKELPIADTVVTASDGVTSSTTQSDSSGYFKLTFRERVWPGETVNLSFRHYDYRPLDLKLQISLRSNLKGLYIAALEPITQVADSGGPFSVVSNIRIRYTVNVQAQANIGTAVKTFEVVNQGNVPCQDQYPCSPD
jgi:hypothetical protein